VLRRLAGSSDFPGRQRLSADRRVPTFELIDANPGDAAHILAFDLDHRRSNLGDQVMLESSLAWLERATLRVMAEDAREAAWAERVARALGAHVLF